MFEVNWCLVGKDVESEPFLFDTWSEAFDFFRNEIYHLKWVMPADNEVEINAVGSKLYAREGITEGQDLTVTVCDISYWLLDRGRAFGDSLSVEERYHL